MSSGDQRVLVCEDEGLTALRLAETLRRLGYRVVGRARNGQEAIRMAAEAHPDVILMDVNMPLLNGIAATEAIMRESPTAILMLTAYPDPSTVAQALAAGASGYLVKPLQDHQLLPAISAAVAHYSQRVSAGAARQEAEALVAAARREAADLERQALDLNKRLEHEQEEAAALARTFICHAPHLPGLETASRYAPASETARVGGDFFDFLELGERRIGIVIGDVCGKGIPAAAVTAMVRHTLRAYAIEEPSPGTLARRLNRALYPLQNLESGFVTLVYGVLDLGEFTFQYVNAGHPPPLLRPATGGQIHELDSTGGLLGLDEGWGWEEASVALQPGDLLALFTDGVTEARNGGSLLQSEGAAEVLRRHAGEDAETVCGALLDRVYEHSAGHLKDDVALVVLRRPPSQ